MRISSHDEVYQKLLLLVIALLLSSMELFIPRIPLIPWLKPGLVNIVTIVWLIRYGYRDTLLFGVLRLWLTSFFFGFSFLAASLAFSGMLLSVSGMALLLKVNDHYKVFGFAGIGITGAVLHNSGQLMMLKLLVGEASLAALQFPVMIVAALLTGTMTGVLASHFSRIKGQHGKVLTDEISIKSIALWKKVVSFLLFLIMISALSFDRLWQNLCFALAAFGISLILTKSLKKTVSGVSRFWFFLLAVLLFTGIVNGGDWNRAAVHFFRLWGWLQFTIVFRYLQSDRLIFAFLHKFFPNREITLSAALIAVEVFPELMKKGVFRTLAHPLRLLADPSGFLENLVETSHEILEDGGWGERSSAETKG